MTFFPAVPGALVLLAYWPGVMTWDAVREYGMALGGPIDDWHPPVMIWLWRRFLPVAHGPGPMLLLQFGLYAAGWASLAGWAGARKRFGLAIALAACSLFPIGLALQGAVLKDCLMAGALLLATGLIALGGRWRRVLALGLLIFAATLRFNAFLACLPLAVAALPARWRATRGRLAGAAVGAALVLIAATPVANRLIGARPSGVELSQVLFDLGGITRFSRADAFPPTPGIADPVRVNDRCYTPELWDPYAWWTDRPCPIGWATAGEWFAAHRVSSYRWWLDQIVHHPVAYAEHRIAHFNRNLRLWAPGGPVEVTPPRPEPNPYGFDVQPNALARLIDGVAGKQARSPLGWPGWWLALAAGVLALAPALPSRRMVLPVAASALLYGGGYLVLSVASDLRYQLWTMLAALIAAAVAANDLASGARPGRERLALSATPVLLVTLVGVLARWLA